MAQDPYHMQNNERAVPAFAQVQPRVRPSGWWYVFAALLPIAVVAFSIASFTPFSADVMDFVFKEGQRVVVPGKSELNLADPGEYVIFHEYHGEIDGAVYTHPEILQGLEGGLTRKDTEETTTLEPLKTKFTYEMGSYAGRGIWSFSISQPGTYILEASCPSLEAQSQKTVLLVKKRPSVEAFIRLGLSVCSLLPAMIAAIVIVMVVYAKRKKSRQAILAAAEADAGGVHPPLV